MTKPVSRRDFLRIAGSGAAAAGVLTGCGPASRYVRREPYMKMPEYTYNGESTYYATTCRECAAGCGVVVRTVQGRAIKVEGNAQHPVSSGKTCARGQATLQGLYNPDRVPGPLRRLKRGQSTVEPLDWEASIEAVAEALRTTRADEIAFVLGTAPDHLFDLVKTITETIGAPPPVRISSLSMFEGRATLMAAAESLFGTAGLPHFDLGQSDFVLSFGANFLETWLSPVAYTREFARMRRGDPERRGHFVQLEPRMSQTAAKADDWVPVRPGSEALIAIAIGRLVAEARGQSLPRAFASADPARAASAAGIPVERLQKIATQFASAQRAIAVPGGGALGHSYGLAAAKAILALNASVGNLGRPGGVFLSPLAPGEDEPGRSATPEDVGALVETMRSGRVKLLFVHGANPIFELPKSLGFAEAMSKVERVISFASFPDETSLRADLVLPDHHSLESFGYQRIAAGTSQAVLSGAQPVVSPTVDTRATADILLAASARSIAALAAALPFTDEVAFIQNRLTALVGTGGGAFAEADIEAFTARFQQHGGWWRTEQSFASTSAAEILNQSIEAPEPASLTEAEFHLVPFVSPTLAEAGANKPWLQELPDPTTTVMWNSWVEMNPETAHELGIENDDIVVVHTQAGAIEAPVYLYPGTRPDVVSIPFGQGHTAYGRYAAGRGVNPLDLLPAAFNEAGDLALAATRVRISRTDRRQVLSRLESRIGVYGEGLGEH